MQYSVNENPNLCSYQVENYGETNNTILEPHFLLYNSAIVHLIAKHWTLKQISRFIRLLEKNVQMFSKNAILVPMILTDFE